MMELFDDIGVLVKKRMSNCYTGDVQKKPRGSMFLSPKQVSKFSQKNAKFNGPQYEAKLFNSMWNFISKKRVISINFEK